MKLKKYLIELLNLLHHFQDLFFDWKYDVQTGGVVEVFQLAPLAENIVHARKYQPTRTGIAKKSFHLLEKLIGELSGKTILDVGCGKGKILLLAKQAGFENCIGVDISKELIASALENLESACLKKKWNRRQFYVLNADILDTPYLDQIDVFYLYNPFDDWLLRQFLNLIIKVKPPKSVHFIYVNPIREYLFKPELGFRLVGRVDNLNHNNRIHIYKLDGKAMELGLGKV